MYMFTKTQPSTLWQTYDDNHDSSLDRSVNYVSEQPQDQAVKPCVLEKNQNTPQ